MKINFETSKPDDQWESTYYLPGRWVAYVTQAVAAGITNIVTLAITIIVTIFVILGGLWLAYQYLPVNVFTIILAVLIADIALGFVVRAILKRR